jgi:hypothetical protein
MNLVLTTSVENHIAKLYVQQQLRATEVDSFRQNASQLFEAIDGQRFPTKGVGSARLQGYVEVPVGITSTGALTVEVPGREGDKLRSVTHQFNPPQSKEQFAVEKSGNGGLFKGTLDMTLSPANSLKLRLLNDLKEISAVGHEKRGC